MKRSDFILKANDILGELDELVGSMPYKGDSCYNSQKVCLQSGLNDIYSLVTGIDQKDLDPNED